MTPRQVARRTRFMRLSVALAACLVAVLAGSALPPAVTLAVGAAPSTLYVDLDPQPGLGYDIKLPPGAQWHAYSTSETANIQADTQDDAQGNPHGFWVTDGTWGVSYWQNDGPLVPGTFAIPGVIEQITCDDPCATVSTTHGSCQGAGEFTIVAIELAEDGSVETIDADFDLRCYGSIMAGSIRYHADRPVTAMLQSADVLSFGIVDVGSASPTQTVTFTSVGETPNELGDLVVAGAAPDAYEVVGDTCSGVTLHNGDMCEVGVRMMPSVRGSQFATLTLPDDTIAGSRRMRLTGAGLQHSTVVITPGFVPAYGPATATFDVTVTPPASGPILYVDGSQRFGPTSQLLTGPDREVWTYTVTLTPGHHVIESEIRVGGHVAPATAEPLEVAIGTKTTILFSTATDDGVATGEDTTLRARLYAGGNLDGGTIRILDAETDQVLAETTAEGAVSTLDHVVADVAAPHMYKAVFVPEDVSVEASDAEYELTSVPGPRPETTMPSEPLWSSFGTVMLDGFGSPDAGTTFQCRVDVSDWFACNGPTVLHSNIGPNLTVSVRAVFANGLADRTPATRAWRFDDTPPSATTPETQAARGQGTGAAVSPLRIAWSGADTASGVDHYLVAMSTDSGAWQSMGATRYGSRNVLLAAGHGYRFRIQAVDRAGNAGAARTGTLVRLDGIQDANSRLVYRGRWARRASPTYWGGSDRSSSGAGATVSLKFTGRSVAWVGSTGPTRGRARVYVNGVLKAAVDLRAARASNRTVVWAANFAQSATRTVVIKVDGTPGRPRVDVDGFVVGR